MRKYSASELWLCIAFLSLKMEQVISRTLGLWRLSGAPVMDSASRISPAGYDRCPQQALFRRSLAPLTWTVVLPGLIRCHELFWKRINKNTDGHGCCLELGWPAGPGEWGWTWCCLLGGEGKPHASPLASRCFLASRRRCQHVPGNLFEPPPQQRRVTSM